MKIVRVFSTLVFDTHNLTNLFDVEGLAVEMTGRVFQVECLRLKMTRVKSGANIPDLARTVCPSLFHIPSYGIGQKLSHRL